ncbi:MAG TPA: fibronectin type III domain-containing protein, partial [Saprospiraceae bacterium]|nr:fibronectin type III domain-containing protein [Saprospiraceae bacterium]
AVSLNAEGLAAMICDDTGTYTVGRMEDGSADYLLYRREDLPTSAPHSCFAEEAQTAHDLPTTVGERGVGCRTVQIYFECDYKMYTDKGSTTAGVTNYVTSLFNQIAALYAAENVSVAISEIYVWTSPDPYQSLTSTSNVLNAFRANRGTNFNGNLAHFLSTRNLGGGIAYVDVICAKSYAFGVSGISTSFQNVPTYSWSVEVVTHELGHNLGSWHTQSCNWPGGAIDNCVQPEGSCPPGPPPTNGGTIMSYCHLSSYGINFNNGFGTLPGNKIRERVTAATCAPQSGTAPTNLNATNIGTTSATLQWGAVTGATNYTVQYKPSTATTWTTSGAITATSLAINNLTANTAYQWQVKTDCSAYSPTANFSTTASGGGGTCNAPSGLSSSGLTASSATLAWAAVSGATGYTVQYKTAAATTWTPAGSSSSPTLSLSNLAASTDYQWQVKANCSGWSATASFSTPASGGTCTAPSTLGTNSITTTSATLTWGPAAGATTYQVQYKASTSSTWIQTTFSTGLSYTLGNLSPNTAYQWQVKSNCSAWSAISNFNTLSTGGGTCNAPSGPNTANITASSATLRWTAASGASSYTVQFKTAASSFWSTAGTTSSLSYAVSGLSPSTSYQWRVKANCSSYTAAITFSTTTGGGGGGLQCDAPANLLNNSIGSTWAVISWGASPGATSYTIQIKLSTETAYTTLGTVSSRQVTLSGMQPSTTYQWRVKANCSAYSSPLT